MVANDSFVIVVTLIAHIHYEESHGLCTYTHCVLLMHCVQKSMDRGVYSVCYVYTVRRKPWTMVQLHVVTWCSCNNCKKGSYTLCVEIHGPWYSYMQLHGVVAMIAKKVHIHCVQKSMEHGVVKRDISCAGRRKPTSLQRCIILPSLMI